MRNSSPTSFARGGIVMVLAVVWVAIQAGCTPSASEPSNRIDTLTFCTDWTTPWAEWVLWENSIAGGFYDKHHIQLLIEKPSLPRESLNMLATGWCDVGYAYQADLMYLRTHRHAPIEAIAALFPRNRWGVAYIRSDDMRSTADLRGKRISLYNLQTDKSYFKLWMTGNGFTPEDFTVVEGGDWATEVLQAGQAQAAGAWENSEVPFLEFANPGKQVIFVPFENLSAAPYLTVMAVNSRFAQRHPGATTRFMSATLESLNDAIDHPRQAVERFLSRHPEIPTAEHPRWHMAWQRAVAMTDPGSMGRIDPERWRQSLHSLATAGTIPRNIDENDGYSTIFCPEVAQQ